MPALAVSVAPSQRTRLTLPVTVMRSLTVTSAVTAYQPADQSTVSAQTSVYSVSVVCTPFSFRYVIGL